MPCHVLFAHMKTLFACPGFSAKFRTWLVDLDEFDAARGVLANEIAFLIADVPTDDDEEEMYKDAAAGASADRASAP